MTGAWLYLWDKMVVKRMWQKRDFYTDTVLYFLSMSIQSVDFVMNH